MAHIKIDDRYYENIKSDYANWQFAFAREAGQNSLDAGATNIDIVTTDLGDGKILVEWEDNGKSMSRQTAEDKFLAIGGTGKAFSGSTGGWGVAKLILAMCHVRYEVHALDFLIKGSKGEYDIVDAPEFRKGVKLSVVIEDDNINIINNAIFNWIAGTTTNCLFTLNGDNIDSAPALNTPKRKLDWCTLYEHGDHINSIHVRINGQLMFTRWTSVNASLTVEITGDSSQYLTTNRDGLLYQYQSGLDKLIERVFADPEAIFNTDDDEIEIYTGTHGRVVFDDDMEAIELETVAAEMRMNDPENVELDPDDIQESSDIDAMPNDFDIATSGTHTIAQPGSYGFAVQPNSTPIQEAVRSKPKIIDGHSLMIVNRLNRPVPIEFIPGSMSLYAQRLMHRWNVLLQATGKILGHSNPITTGWIFKAGVIAEYRRNSEVGDIVLLNPIVIENKDILHRWKFGWASFNLLLTTAVHELTHAKWSYHGDGWAAAFTHNIAKISTHKKTLNSLFNKTAS